jgi:hypothetical protein
MREVKERWIAVTRDGWYAVGEGNVEIAYCKDKADAELLKYGDKKSDLPRPRRFGEPCTLIMFPHGASVQIYRTGQRGTVAGRTGDSKVIINGEDGVVHKFHPATRAIPLEEIVKGQP